MDQSFLLIADNRALTASRAYFEPCPRLGGWWHTFRVAAIIPEQLRDWLCAFIARDRYRCFGKADYRTRLTAAPRGRLW
jgi:predicted DCC family thiol-disulfide oxidoreductase YuxK